MTTTQAFKFIELYSLIQLTSCCLLYTVGSNLTDSQFTYIDLVALVPLAIVQARTGSYLELTADMPTATLFYWPVLLSICTSTVIQASFQIYFFKSVKRQEFYEPADPLNLHFIGANPSYEDTVIFMVSIFQYVVTCLAFSVSRPFRQPFWTNIPFLICVVLLLVFNTILVFAADNSPMAELFTFLPFEGADGTSYYDYRAWISVGILLNTVITFGAE